MFASLVSDYGWPPSSLAVDQYYVYWTNATEGHLYKISRSQPMMATMMGRLSEARNAQTDSHESKRVELTREQVPGVRKIATLGINYQPLPGQ